MGRIDFFLGVLLCALLLPARTPGFFLSSVSAMSTYGLTGSVSSEGGNQRLARARVVLCDGGGNPLEESATSDSGEFSFQNLWPGHYILRVAAVGYEAAELELDLSFSPEHGINVSLKPERNAAIAPPSGAIISAHELAMPKSARDLLASGKEKLQTQKNPQAALRDFQSAIGQAPTYYEAYFQSGMAYLTLQDSGQAETQFRKSMELSQKKYPYADIALGTLLLHRNVADEGESLLRHGLALNPNSWPGQLELGELELSRGHLELALSAAEKAAGLAPQQAMVYRLLAVILLRQKNYPALVSALDSYIELDPDSPAGLRAKELRTQAEQQLANSPEAAVAVEK